MIPFLNDDNGNEFYHNDLANNSTNFPNSFIFCLFDVELDEDGSGVRE